MTMILVTHAILAADLSLAANIPADQIEPIAYRWSGRGYPVLHAPPAGRGLVNGLLVPDEYADILAAAGIEYESGVYYGHA